MKLLIIYDVTKDYQLHHDLLVLAQTLILSSSVSKDSFAGCSITYTNDPKVTKNRNSLKLSIHFCYTIW